MIQTGGYLQADAETFPIIYAERKINMNTIKVDKLPTIRRLPDYLRILRDLLQNGRDIVSSSQLAEAMNIESILVRKDLALTGIEGTPRIGYSIPHLITAIEDFLGWGNAPMDAFLIGAGQLGSAILGYQEIRDYGHRVVAAFDIDPQRIGMTIHGIRVFSLTKMPELLKRLNVRLAILAVPPAAAQRVTDILVKEGIQGIWNFTSVTLDVPDGVITHKEDLISGLAVLSVRLARVGSGSSSFSTATGDRGLPPK
jgi:redox-sensing transcriptional repressor